MHSGQRRISLWLRGGPPASCKGPQEEIFDAQIRGCSGCFTLGVTGRTYIGAGVAFDTVGHSPGSHHAPTPASVPPTPLGMINVVPKCGQITLLTVPRSAPAHCPICHRRSGIGATFVTIGSSPPCLGKDRLTACDVYCVASYMGTHPANCAPPTRRSRRLQDIDHRRGLALDGSPVASWRSNWPWPAAHPHPCGLFGLERHQDSCPPTALMRSPRPLLRR